MKTEHKIFVNCPDCWRKHRAIKGTQAVIIEDDDCETTWHVTLGPCRECKSESTATYYDTALSRIVTEVKLAWTRETR